MFKIQFPLLFLLFACPLKLFTQTSYEKEAIRQVDTLIGYENTGLYNGTRYIEEYRTVNERHKFFSHGEFQNGNLIYNGQYYANVPLKYDLDSDDLLLEIGYSWKFPILKLYKNRISEFSFENQKFINLGNQSSKSVQGFQEVLWTSKDFTLLKKHKKKKFRRIFQTVVYFEFEADNSYNFKYHDDYYPLERKSDLIKLFPRFKKEIKSLYNKKSVQKNPEPQYILILGELQKYLKNERL